MIAAHSEQLVTLDELRARMLDLRARETNLCGQIDALDTQVADRDAYLKLADDLEGFLAHLSRRAATSDVNERQRVLRLVVKTSSSHPRRSPSASASPSPEERSKSPSDDTESDQRADCLLRRGRGSLT
jgi:site-specific DNA recombinase